MAQSPHRPAPGHPHRVPCAVLVGAGLALASLLAVLPADALTLGAPRASTPAAAVAATTPVTPATVNPAPAKPAATSASAATAASPTTSAAPARTTTAPRASAAAVPSSVTAIRAAAGTETVAAAERVDAAVDVRRTPSPVEAADPDAPGAAPVDPAALPAPTVVVRTGPELQAALDGAGPGAVIGLEGGTYTGPFTIRASGTAAAPVVVRPTGTGPVVLTATLPQPACSATGPDGDRTLTFRKGASHWLLTGLTIRGGVMIASENAPRVQDWFATKVDQGDWRSRRAVPGRSTADREAARGTLGELSRLTSTDLRPSDGIALVHNTITGKGVHARLSRDGVLQDNTLTDIACGTGPAVWLTLFSDGWTVTGNTVSRVGASTASHYMQEGIRLGGATSYTRVAGNLVTDLPAGGRAFTTDQDASFNAFTGNRAERVDIGFNDQMSGWGNTWVGNTARNFRVAGFSFRTADGSFTAPRMDTSTRAAVVRCNVATEGAGPSFQAGALMGSTVSDNAFGTVSLSKNLQSYFAGQGNTWDGRSQVPAASDPTPRTGAGC